MSRWRGRMDARGGAIRLSLGAIPLSRGAVAVSGNAMRGATVSLRLTERDDRLTIVSNAFDRVHDAAREAIDALIAGDDRRNERELRRALVHDRAFTRSCNPIARSDALFDVSDARIASDGSLAASADRLANAAASPERKVRSADRAIASSDRAFALSNTPSRSTPRNSL